MAPIKICLIFFITITNRSIFITKKSRIQCICIVDNGANTRQQSCFHGSTCIIDDGASRRRTRNARFRARCAAYSSTICIIDNGASSRRTRNTHYRARRADHSTTDLQHFALHVDSGQPKKLFSKYL